MSSLPEEVRIEYLNNVCSGTWQPQDLQKKADLKKFVLSIQSAFLTLANKFDPELGLATWSDAQNRFGFFFLIQFP